jgi:hypothetical protein
VAGTRWDARAVLERVQGVIKLVDRGDLAVQLHHLGLLCDLLILGLLRKQRNVKEEFKLVDGRREKRTQALIAALQLVWTGSGATEPGDTCQSTGRSAQEAGTGTCLTAIW